MEAVNHVPLCPITPQASNLGPITNHSDNLEPITRHAKPLCHAESTIKLSCVADFDSSPDFHVDLNNLVQLYGENFKDSSFVASVYALNGILYNR